MATYEGSRQIYAELVDASDSHWLLGLLAFALIEQQRVEWEKHFEVLEGHPPSDDAVHRWYRDLPPEQLLRAKGEAENSLKAYGSEVWDEFRSREREAIHEDIIVQEIRLFPAGFGRSLESAWRRGWSAL